jgi:hypothetical protein
MAHPEHCEHEILRISLDHAWAWYNMRFGQFLQLLNFALLGFAILSAAYVTALGANLNAVASGVGLMAAAVSLAVAGAGRQIQRRADLAEEPLRALQDRLAQECQIGSLRMFTEAAAQPRVRSRQLVMVVFCLASVAWLAAAVYPMTV